VFPRGGGHRAFVSASGWDGWGESDRQYGGQEGNQAEAFLADKTAAGGHHVIATIGP
jgi:hypothetical protein